MVPSNGHDTKRARLNPELSRVKKVKTFLGNTINNKQKIAACWVDLIQILGNGDDGVGGGDDDDELILEPDRPYTIGRNNKLAQFVFDDPRVSKQHCQLLFDASLKKVYLLNGTLLLNHCVCGGNDSVGSCVVDHFRGRLLVRDNERGIMPCLKCTYVFKSSLNGLFVNGDKVGEGLVVELCVGDEVMLVCGKSDGVCGSRVRIGFVVRRVVFQEEVVIPGYDEFRLYGPRLVTPLEPSKVNKRVFALRVSDSESPSLECGEVVGRAKSLSSRCKRILRSDDPVSCIRRCVSSPSPIGGSNACKENKFSGFDPSDNFTISEPHANVAVLRENKMMSCASLDTVKGVDALTAPMVQSADIVVSSEKIKSSQPKADIFRPEGCDGDAYGSKVDDTTANASVFADREGKNLPHFDALRQNRCRKEFLPPPGKNFYLNRLESMYQSSFDQQNVVSLPELLHPLSSISRMFIATFTSDIKWFLSYCDIPFHLPVTLACHNTEKCWSADPENRSCVPYPDFPNLVVVYPPFPESIAFGNDRKRHGIGCHHPKLFVLQREDSIRVIITSANLVAKQWNHVTNTIWWQDFPRRNFPDCTSLFNKIHEGDAINNLKSDFAAQLAGFLATLVTDVPSQAYWIFELTKYDFTGANAYLVASTPGVHSYKSPAILPVYKSKCSEKFLGSVEASVVGLSHLFRAAKDSNGLQLKKLAAYLGKSSERGCNLSEVILRRDKNVPADANAVSVLVPNPAEFSKADWVQLGFLPRAVAKWVSPLWDIGFFRFYGYVNSREALTAAFGENNIKVQLILYVSEGPQFREMTKIFEPEHIVALCALIASLQRSTGLWRLEEVLHQYKWPEHLESDFIYGSSSIGTSVGPQFLAAFSSSAGKRSHQLFDSEESDPEWACWNVSHELKHPSMRILFPSIDRVKSAHCGIMLSKHLLCFSEKTWQRLKNVDIFHDAIPHPSDRVGYPMHVKVARRRFQSKPGATSFGWIYCGSHNMSAAAWGRQISGPDKNRTSSPRLHICNYELGVIFIFPPPDNNSSNSSSPKNSSSILDDIQMPFVMPAPKYGPRDRPATKRAMAEALAEAAELPAELAGEEEVPEEDDGDGEVDVTEVGKYLAREEDEERAYADALWDQVDSSQS